MRNKTTGCLLISLIALTFVFIFIFLMKPKQNMCTSVNELNMNKASSSGGLIFSK